MANKVLAIITVLFIGVCLSAWGQRRMTSTQNLSSYAPAVPSGTEEYTDQYGITWVIQGDPWNNKWLFNTVQVDETRTLNIYYKMIKDYSTFVYTEGRESEIRFGSGDYKTVDFVTKINQIKSPLIRDYTVRRYYMDKGTYDLIQTDKDWNQLAPASTLSGKIDDAKQREFQNVQTSSKDSYDTIKIFYYQVGQVVNGNEVTCYYISLQPNYREVEIDADISSPVKQTEYSISMSTNYSSSGDRNPGVPEKVIIVPMSYRLLKIDTKELHLDICYSTSDGLMKSDWMRLINWYNFPSTSPREYYSSRSIKYTDLNIMEIPIGYWDEEDIRYVVLVSGRIIKETPLN
jgi:hypothetical protein